MKSARSVRGCPRRALAILVMLLLLVSACSDDNTSGTPELTRVSIQMSWIIDGAVGTWLYGIEHGVFERHGIDLELIPGRGSGFTLQQLSEGQVQFGQSHLLPYLVHRAEVGTGLTAVSTVVAEATVGILLSEPAASLADLVGGTFVCVPFSSFRYILPVILQLNGIPGDAVNIELVDGAPFALLFEGRADGVEAHKGGGLAAGLITAEELDEEVYFLDLTDFGLVGYEVLLATDDQIESDPDLVRRLVAALLEATQLAQEATGDEIADLVLERSPELRRDVILLQWEQIKQLASGAGALDSEVVMTNLGYITDGLGIEHGLDPADTYTTRFLP